MTLLIHVELVDDGVLVVIPEKKRSYFSQGHEKFDYSYSKKYSPGILSRDMNEKNGSLPVLTGEDIRYLNGQVCY